MQDAVINFKSKDNTEEFANLWSRLFARTFDNIIYAIPTIILTVSLQFLLIAPLVKTQSNQAVQLVITLLLAVFVYASFVISSLFIEAFSISNYGATLGKKLMNIRIVDKNGEKLDFSSAFKRSLWVYIRGCYLHIPVASIMACAAAADRIENFGIAAWDEKSNSQIIHKKPTLIGTLILFGVLIGIPMLAMIAGHKPPA